MKKALKFWLTVAIALWSALLFAQQLEIIPLKSKNVDQVLPTLQPLLERGGTLTGANNQLFLRTSPANRAEIMRVLAAIDVPTRRLLIHVAQNRQAENADRGVEARGQVTLGSTRQANVNASAWDTKSVRGENSTQRVQTIEGGQAFIQVGRSLAVPMRQRVYGPGGSVVSESLIYRDIGSGFYAEPRLNGQRVTIDITQQAENFDAAGRGGVNSQRLATTVTGRLGEWIELGGTGREASASQTGTTWSSGDARDNRSIWLMVEALE